MTAFQSIVPECRIALLIDGDNIRGEHIGRALDKLAPLGAVTIRRAYGDWERRKDMAAALQQHAVRAFHQPPLTDYKNGSDIALAVDAVDLVHTQPIDAFAILSSDADFAPLMLRLREAGRDVYGFGDKRAPQALRSACTRFFDLDDPDGRCTEEERAILRQAVETSRDGTGRALLSRIGKQIPVGRIQYKSLSALLLREGFLLSEDHKYCEAD